MGMITWGRYMEMKWGGNDKITNRAFIIIFKENIFHDCLRTTHKKPGIGHGDSNWNTTTKQFDNLTTLTV